MSIKIDVQYTIVIVCIVLLAVTENCFHRHHSVVVTPCFFMMFLRQFVTRLFFFFFCTSVYLHIKCYIYYYYYHYSGLYYMCTGRIYNNIYIVQFLCSCCREHSSIQHHYDDSNPYVSFSYNNTYAPYDR